MMLAAVGIFLAARRKPSTPTAKSYVQDGLIAMWDGIENAGWGVHDANDTKWKNLVGSDFITLRNAVINYDNVYFSKSSNGSAAFPKPYGAIEIVLAKSSFRPASFDSTVINIGAIYSGYGICAPYNKLMDTDDNHSAPYVDFTPDTPFTATFNKSGITTIGVAKNGVVGSDGTTTAGSRYAEQGTDVINGLGNGGARSSLLWIYSLRFYSRNLTAAEIAANYAIDKERFKLP